MLRARFEADGEVREGAVNDDVITTTDGEYDVDDVKLLPPCEPGKIVGVMVNYERPDVTDGPPVSSETLQKGMYFFKPPDTIVAPGEPVVAPSISDDVIYEGELGAVIGKECRSIPGDEVHDYVEGYTCANDVTARDYGLDGDWVRSKGCDTFTPLGPYLQTDLIVPPDNPTLTTRVNGEVRQETGVTSMIHSIPEAIADISSFLTLNPGDLVLTGTPNTTGERGLAPGDVMEVEIDDIGTITNEYVSG